MFSWRDLGRGSERWKMRKWSEVLPRGNSLHKTFSAFGVIFFLESDDMLSLPSSRDTWLPRRQASSGPQIAQSYGNAALACHAHRCQTAASLPSHLPRRSEFTSQSRATTRPLPSHWRSSSPSRRRSSRAAWWAKSMLRTETHRTR